MQEIVNFIGTVGFPIVACLLMAWYVKYVTDKQREEVASLNAQHDKEMESIREALENNTRAVDKLTVLMEGVMNNGRNNNEN